MTADRDDWPVHQPGPAYEAPIPGVHWYAGCDPDQPRVDPLTGICEGCGERACGECGRSNCPDHECLCPCHYGRGDSGSGYSYVWDDDRGIRHEDWISCGCESKDPAVCMKERPE